jgi:hypothetical protein
MSFAKVIGEANNPTRIKNKIFFINPPFFFYCIKNFGGLQLYFLQFLLQFFCDLSPIIAKQPAPCIIALNKMRAFFLLFTIVSPSPIVGLSKIAKIHQLSDSNRSRTLTIKTFYAIIQLHLKFKQKEKLWIWNGESLLA